MRDSLRKLISWLAGVIGLIFIAWYFRPAGFVDTLAAVSTLGIIAWCALTIAARLLLARTTVEPMHALGYRLSMSDAFWIGWLRTFANQIVPMSGVAAYVKVLRDKTAISWSELAALATPQFVLAAAALGVVGLAAVACNFHALADTAIWLLAIFSVIIVAAILLANGAAPFIELLPKAVSARAVNVSTALRKFASRPGLIARLIAYHALVIVLRGGRLWVLFAAAGVDLEWQQLALILAIAESSFLLQLTPGGLGIREAAVLGGAALVGIAPEVAASAALIDRLFTIAVTVLFALPAAMILSSAQQIDN